MVICPLSVLQAHLSIFRCTFYFCENCALKSCLAESWVSLEGQAPSIESQIPCPCKVDSDSLFTVQPNLQETGACVGVTLAVTRVV